MPTVPTGDKESGQRHPAYGKAMVRHAKAHWVKVVVVAFVGLAIYVAVNY